VKIGLYFGSFNPIHKGHTGLATFILGATSLDEVWLVVSPNNPLKDPSKLIDEQLRYQMACLATEDIQGIRATDLEFTLPRPNYTINTLRRLTEQYPEHQFSLIMGSDNMAIFDHWREHDAILAGWPILVYPREGDDMEELKARFPQMTILPQAPLFPISSTRIRAEICCGTYSEEWLDPKVVDFLKKNANKFANIKK